MRIAFGFFILIALWGVVLAFLSHSCFVCLFSLDSLRTYLKGNRFILRDVGWFVLRRYFVVVETELSVEEPEVEWSRQLGTVDVLLVRTSYCPGQGPPFDLDNRRGSAVVLLCHPFPRWSGVGCPRGQGDIATWSPGPCHLCSPRLRCLGPRTFYPEGPQISSRACCGFPPSQWQCRCPEAGLVVREQPPQEEQGRGGAGRAVEAHVDLGWAVCGNSQALPV